MKIMQEQHPYKMTPEQGWSRMEPILDQAMPVPQRSRRFILFWWTAAAVIAVGLIGYGTWMNRDAFTEPVAYEQTHGKETPAVQQTEDVGISSSTPSLIDQQEVTNSEATEVLYVSSEKENQNAISPSRSIVTGPSGKVKSSHMPLVVSSKSEIQTSGSANTNQLVVVTENGSIAASDAGTTTSVATEFSEHVAASSSPALTGMSKLEFLPLTDVSWDTASGITMDIEHNEIRKTVLTNRKLLSPYLSVSGMAGFEKGYGGHGGVGVDLAITPSLSLSADLGYTIYKPRGEVFTQSRDLAESNSAVLDDLGYLGIGEYISADVLKNTSNTPSTIAPLVETLTQFQCGLGLKLDVSKKIFIEGGAILGFGSKGESRYPIVSYDPYNVPINGTAYTIENSFDTYGVIRSTTASLYGSVGLRPSRRSEIFVQYRHALNSYLTTGPSLSSAAVDRTDYIRGLNVGVRYHL